MTDTALEHFLGRPGPDAGCDACFRLMDEFAEAKAGGEELAARFPGAVTHLLNCTACREDLDALCAAAELHARP
jgi:hypothetical protein